MQLFGKVRLHEEDPKNVLLNSLQTTQNKFARFLNGSKLTDKINNNSIYKNLNLLSINQINAQIKLMEVWKSNRSPSYPVQWVNTNENKLRTDLRSSNQIQLKMTGMSNNQMSTFCNDAACIWNHAPDSIKSCTSIYTVKKEIKKFVSSIPL